MCRKLRVISVIAVLVLLLMSCPDPASVVDPPAAGSDIENTGTSSSGDDGSAPEAAGDTDLTETDISMAAELIIGVSDSERFQEDAGTPGSGLESVEMPEPAEQYKFTDYDISGFAFNTGGYLTMSGTLTYTETMAGCDAKYDITLTGGSVSEIAVSFSYDNEYNTPVNII